MFVPCADTCEVSLQFILRDGEFAENVFGVQRATAWDAASMTAMANAFAQWWDTGDGTFAYSHVQNNGVTINAVGIRDLTTESSPSMVVPPSGLSQNNGHAAGGPLQNGVSFAVTARTGLSGRSFRGRTFLAGLDAAVLSSGDYDAIDSASAAGIVKAFNALITKVHATDSGSQLVVISRRANNVWRAAGVMTPVIAYGYHDLFLDYQRRRAPAHNRHH